MMHVEQIDQLEDLVPYRAAWRALLEETPGATFFQSLEWLEVYWKYYGENQQLRVQLVLHNDELIGILPLVIRTERTKIGALRFLTYPLDYWGSYYGPIGAVPSIILDATLDALRARPRDWDILELRWVGHDTCDCNMTLTAMKRHGFPALPTVLDHTALIQFEGSWNEYLNRRTSKWRNNYRRWQRRLDELGTLQHIRYRPRGDRCNDGDPRWDLFEACQEVARKSWQSQSPDGTTICHDSIRDFIRAAHAAAAAVGTLDLNLLLLDDTPVAFAYNYRFKDSVYGLRIGYDPAAGRNGAGNLLYGKIIEDSFQRGDQVYDLGPGSLACKKYFHTNVQPVYRCSHFPIVSLRPQLLRVKRFLDSRATARMAHSVRPTKPR